MLYALGSYTRMDGPGVGILEEKNGELRLLCASGAVVDPTWVEQSALHPHILYTSCLKDGKGAAASFSWTRDGLTLLSYEPSGGASCCHVAVDRDETHLYAVSYGDGVVSVFPLDKGVIGPVMQTVPHDAPLGPNPVRQNCSHAHQCVFRPDSDQLFVCNLGTDQVVIYDRQKDGTLKLSDTVAAIRPGMGPRHLLFDGPNRFYLVGEMEGWIAVYDYMKDTWQGRQILSTVPGGSTAENTAAALYRDETHLFVSNRGYDSIAVFQILPDGLLAFEKELRTPGNFPRDFQLHQGGFLLAQQNQGGVAFMDNEGNVRFSLDIPGAVRLCPLTEK